MDTHQFAFIAGLHRSGTTLLARALAEHPDVSGFRDTGAIEDEGQFLQSVYPPARVWGGPGRFGFNPLAHWTETSVLATPASASRIFAEWSRHWDLNRAVLLEKSPPNLLKLRFLQALFPTSSFVLMLRHPIAVSLATSKWCRGQSLSRLIEHWVVCHEIARGDAGRLERLHVASYEGFTASPQDTVKQIDKFLGIPSHETSLEVKSGVNNRYFDQWQQRAGGLISRWSIRRAIRSFEDRVGTFGYSLEDLERCEVGPQSWE